MDYGLSSKISKTDERQSLWAKQREERGFDDTETWGLDVVFASFIVPRLEAFKELHVCHPTSVTMKKWDKILQKMIDGFKEIIKKEESIIEFDYKKAKKGLKLFSKWYLDLWW